MFPPLPRRKPWNINGPVVQLVRTPACHAGGRRFEPVPGRHYADIAQSVECILGKDEVTGSNPVISSTEALENLEIFVFKAFFYFIKKHLLNFEEVLCVYYLILSIIACAFA